MFSVIGWSGFLLESDDYILDKKYLDMLKDVNCILVDECQFLTVEQVEDFWKIAKQWDIPVICYGLRSNFKGEGFASSMRLFVLADELEEMPTICECGKRMTSAGKNKGFKCKKCGNKIYSTDIKIKKNIAVCRITEGYRHQVRAHLAYSGYPICGDMLYNPNAKPGEKMQFLLNR